ncbi:RagB/SusD family nutrient uptake outer membrane protein [Reichenbachiella sp. MALMAid0571]|uniref:RagB/SusD family nutrient uptake outer membrane protein n=1 Tax=Reichenbachiella sp. MALMAid0571 TaxID=3143939 RepID=UPI0032DE9410
MMEKIKNKSFLMFVSLITICICILNTSCEKDTLLDITPTDRFSEDVVFNDENLAQSLVYNTYESLRRLTNPAFGGYDGITDIMLWSRNISGYYPDPINFQDGFRDYIHGDISPDNVENFAGWGSYYTSIATINSYFEKIEGSTIDPDKIKIMNGEMRFIRAYLYFDLIRLYGGVPLVTTSFDFADEESLQIGRNTYDEVANFVVSESNLAIEELASAPEVMGKITPIAAKALKARMLLYMASPLNNPGNDMSKWSAAETATMAVLNSGKSLTLDYTQIPFKTNYQSDEIIFARAYNATSRIYQSDINFMLWPSFGGLGSNHMMPTQQFADMFQMADGQRITDEGSGYDPQKFWENRDPRFYSSIMYPGSGPFNFKYDDGTVQFRRQQNYESITDPTGVSWNTEPFVNPNYPDRNTGVRTFGFSMAWNFGSDGFTYADKVFGWPGKNAITRYNVLKFIDWNNIRWNTTSDVPQMQLFFRITEFYLNMAEIKIALGQEAEAKIYLDQVRARSGMPALTSSGVQLVEDYRKERAIELHLEDHRFFDILRWKIGSETIGQPIEGIVESFMDWSVLTHQLNEPGGAFGTLSFTFGSIANQYPRNWDDKLYRLPIPASEINRSGEKITQNEGYNR